TWKAAAAGVALAAGMSAQAGETGALTLTREGQPAATIVLSGRPTQAAQFAAFELRWYVKGISGATLPIVREGAKIPDGHVKLWVGDTSRARDLGLTQQAFFKQERAVLGGSNEVVMAGKDAPGFLEVTYDPDTLARGNWPDPWEERGTLHAVYDFLRDACGVRWFNPTDTGTVMPQQPTLTVKPLSKRSRPVFTFRNTPYFVNGGVNPGPYHGADVLWGGDLQSKGEKGDGFRAWDALAYTNLHARFPGNQYNVANWVAMRLFLLRAQIGGEKMDCNHSMTGYYDRFWKKSDDPRLARLFVEQRPEFFAQGYPGEPLKGMTQLCYSNRKLIEQVAQDARDYYDGMTEQGIFWNPQLPNPFPVEPMDSSDFCRCANCQALIEKSKDYGAGNFYSRGIHSDYFFNFVNEVQLELAKTHPDKPVATLAYMTHAWPPRTVKLDPRVIVHFCFADSGLAGGAAEYDNEWRLLHEWGAEAKKSGRALYLWHYLGHVQRYTASRSSDYYCFPDFQAHTIAEQMKAFKELGYRGTFWCGTYLEPDAYVAFRMMDDAAPDADALLDEYFDGLYGAAAAPLKKMYLEMETLYRDVARKPQPKPRMANNDEAWGQLGTTERMAAWGKLMEQAKGLARTEREQRNVAIFDLGFWQYMLQGRAKFEKRATLPQVSLRAPRVPAAGGDAAKVDWSKAATMGGGWFVTGSDTPAARQLSGRLANDGKYLYLELTDPCDTKRLENAPKIFPYDDWEIFLAGKRAMPYRQLAVGPTGRIQLLLNGEVNWQMYKTSDEHGIRAVADTSAPDKWVTRLAFPFQDLTADGVKPGGTVYLNVIRVSSVSVSGASHPTVEAWISNSNVHELDRLAEVTLE
ncbi:MAG: DUF4838 domain-containing protein, partial [Kiritimatiellae bacterium]|nr:DUF4838 domain-containing protein [Kiritimatiellia bacterium]